MKVVIQRNHGFGFGFAETFGFRFRPKLKFNRNQNRNFPSSFLFFISLTSVDVERLFSTAGDILTPERNRLSPETAEKMLFLRENLPIVDFQY